MFNMIIILLGVLNSEPVGTNDYRITRFILSNLGSLANYSISQIAEACFVSVSSVSRFCRKVGFQDFTELKSQFYLWPGVIEEKFDFPKKEPLQLKDSFLAASIANLKLLQTSLQQADIDRLVVDLQSYSQIAAFGTLHSQSAVLNLQTDLLSSDIVMDTRNRLKEQIDYVQQADEQTLILLFSREGTHFKRFLVHNLQLNPRRKPKIVMITANPNYQKHKYIDYTVLYQDISGYAAYPSSVEAICSILALEIAARKKN